VSIACSTSAFKMPLDEALGEVTRLGFSFVDLIAIKGWDHIEASELAEDWEPVAGRVEAMIEARNLKPAAMNLAVAHPHQRDDETNAQRLREVEAVARLMKRLGVTVASFYPGFKAEDRPWDDVLKDTAETVSEMLSVAGREGVTLAVELHFNTPFETVEQGLRLLEAVPGLQVAYDPSHYAMQEIDLRRTEPFLDRTAHCHLRDAGPGQMQRPFGAGTVDIDWILDALAERDYAGHYSIEYLPGLEGGAEDSILRLKDKLTERLG
jgi:sugar phosphate isomerase/epimerase